MFTLGVQRQFTAWHYLIGGDWGAENLPHTHDYRLEIRLEATTLDRHGYCVDIVQVEAALDAFVATSQTPLSLIPIIQQKRFSQNRPLAMIIFHT